MSKKMQVIKFKPIFKETIWGGGKIPRLKHSGGYDGRPVGESWEISGLEGCESIVDGGEYDGISLSRLTEMLKGRLVGERNYRRFGNRFPLLVKFIDARRDLSIQVHPDDGTAMRRGMANGKNEMWFVLDSEPYASLRCGLREPLAPGDIAAKVADGAICDAVSLYHVKAGDCFYIPAGRVHSIGAGCFIAEIQQTSDATYRIYDFGRRDSHGNLRQLHLEEAAECIDYTVDVDCKAHYRPGKDVRVPLVECSSFSTSLYDVGSHIVLDYSALDSFVILVGVGGAGIIAGTDGTETMLRECETLLVPASVNALDVRGELKFLEVYP